MSKFFFYMAWLQCLLVTATFANNGHAQQLENIQISNDWKKVKLESAFADIQNQTDYFFTYDSNQIEKLTVSSTNEELPLLEVLKFISSQTGLKFSISDDLILVEYEKEDLSGMYLTKQELSIPPLYELKQLNINVIHQVNIKNLEDERIITGKVTSEEGEPLIGATVQVKGSGQGTVTDVDGAFSIAVPDEGAVILVVSYLGYLSQEVAVNERSDINIILKTSAVQLEGVVVRGLRKSLANALAIKQQAVNNVDVIVAEDIAKFPQTNVSEALQRVSGIQIRRDNAGGRGNEVSVRGLPAEYTQVTINGQATPNSSDASRSFNFNALPAELFGRVEVFKSPTANLDEGGIGGTVNLVTRKPFDFDEQTFVASAEGVFNSQAQGDNSVTPRASLTYANNWNNKFGMLASASYSKFLAASEGYDNVRYEIRSYDLDGDGETEINDLRVPFPRYVSQGQEVDRLSFNAAVQYQASDNFNLLLEGNYVDFSQVETRYTPIWFLPRDPGVPVSITNQGQFMESGTYDNVWFRLENQQQENITGIATVGLTGRWRLNDWTISANGTYQQNNRDSERFRYYADNYNTMTYSVADDLKWFDIQTETDLTDASQFEMAEARRYEWDLRDVITSGQVDFKNEINSNFHLDFGGKFRSRNKSRNYYFSRLRNSDDGFPTDFASVSMLLDGFLDNVDEATGPSEFLVHDWDKARAVYEPIIPFNRDEVERKDAYYDITENITAGYAMGTFKNNNFQANFGVRVVNTALTSKGLELDEDTDTFSDREVTSSYLDVLPSANLRLKIQDNVFIRGAFARVMTRPNLSDLTSFREVDDANQTISAANPELEPFRANQYDLSLEIYPNKESLLAFTFFRKDIESFITDETIRVPFNGDTYFLSRPVNGNNATIEGLEINYQQPFTFLPSPFDGFGAVVNYTLSVSDFEETLESGETETYSLPNNSRNSYNLVLYYETDKVSLRVAQNYRSRFLRSKPVPADGLKYRDDYSQTDFSGSYNITDNIALTLNVLNLFNSQRFECVYNKLHFRRPPQ